MLLRKKYSYFIDRFLPLSLHFSAWLIYAILVYNVNPVLRVHGGALHYYGLKLLPQLLTFYLNYSILIPRVLSRLRILSYFVLNLAAIATLATLSLIVSGGDFGFQGGRISPLVITMINDGLFATLALVVRFSIDWFRQKLKEKQKENEALKSELSFLKAQVNPHFLFNSLNNLYALVLKQDNKAPDVILGISRIMRYLLYETNGPKVSLPKEIDILLAYDALQQLREREKHDIIQVIGNPGQLQIAPLLLLPLVENLYKHGQPPYSIQITIEENSLVLCTKNALKDEAQPDRGGVGLINLKRRLELLYPDRFQLKQIKEADQFKSTLSIKLD